jgi:xylose dehydrogenase (NAD/NADP)
MELDGFAESFKARDWDTNPDGTVQLAIVGVGGFARMVVLPALTDADYCEPAVLVSGSPETAGKAAADHDCRLIDYEAYADGTAAGSYDAVYVATPNALHLPHVETAASLDKPVICEKPVESTVTRAQQLVTTCADADVTLMTAYRMQTDPVFRCLRTFLADGGLGRLTTLHGDFTYPVLGGSRGSDQWRLDPDLAGGGALADIGVYPLNIARYLLDAEPEQVSGVMVGSGTFSDVDETVSFLVEFNDRTTGAFSASFTGPTDTWFGVAGSEGRILVEDAFQPRADRTVRVMTSDGTVRYDGVGTDEVREEFDYFAHCLLTDTRPEPDGRDGLADMRAMAAIYRDAGTAVPMAD